MSIKASVSLGTPRVCITSAEARSVTAKPAFTVTMITATSTKWGRRMTRKNSR